MENKNHDSISSGSNNDNNKKAIITITKITLTITTLDEKQPSTYVHHLYKDHPISSGKTHF